VLNIHKKKQALLLDLEADQEEQPSLLMLKVDPGADSGQDLLPIAVNISLNSISLTR
jgi:hypothetical protein